MTIQNSGEDSTALSSYYTDPGYLPRTYVSYVPEILARRYPRPRPAVLFILVRDSLPSVELTTLETQVTMKAYVLLLLALVAPLQVIAISNGIESPGECT